MPLIHLLHCIFPRGIIVVCIHCIFIVLVCTQVATSASPFTVRLTSIFSDPFERPVEFLPIPLPNQTDRALVLEQGGRIFEVSLKTKKRSLILDLSHLVHTRHNEEGLLSGAFSPNFPEDPRLFIYFSRKKSQSWLKRSARQTVLHEVILNPDQRPLSIQQGITSETPPLFSINQPYGNHNGGAVRFGPDGLLYLSVGDGGAGGDPLGHGQNCQTPLGSILRFDVSQPSRLKTQPNPPFKSPCLKELWAIGLRNPWRMSFDSQTGELWVADVGQSRYEEVNRIQRGGNYGWKVREGFHQYGSSSSRTSLIDPIVEYNHREGSSITGGVIYRRQPDSELYGWYLYADFVSGRLWGFSVDSVPSKYSQLKVDQKIIPVLLKKTALNISSFALDHHGQVLILAFNGLIYRLSL